MAGNSVQQEFLLTIGPGGPAMHRLVEEELRECLGVTEVERVGQARFYFACCPDPADSFFSLRAPEKLYAVVMRCRADSIELPSNQEEAEAALASMVAASSGWNTALSTWRGFAAVGGGPDREALPRTFRATGKRAGKRAAHLSSNGISEFIGESVANTHGWQVDLHDYDIDIVVHLNDDHLVVMLPLLEQGSTHQSKFAHQGLSQPVAWAMARSVGPLPGELVVDPMCGSGIVLLEAAQCWQGAFYIGFDNDAGQLERSAKNLKMLSADTAQSLSFCRGDARRLPLSDDSVDAIVCDLPFGKQFGSEEENVLLYPSAVAEFWRVLRPGSGRVVLLTNHANADKLAEALSLGQSGRWQVKCRRKMLLGFMEATLFLAIALPSADSDAQDMLDATTGSAAVSLPVQSFRLPWETNTSGRRTWSAMKAVLRRPMRLVTAGKKCNR